MKRSLGHSLAWLLLAFALAAIPGVYAQSADTSAESSLRGIPAATDAQTRDDLLARAAQLRAKYEADPRAADARETRRLEAVALLQAGFAGDDTQQERRDALVTEMLSDNNMESARRCELAAYAGNLEVVRQAGTWEERLNGHERVARELIARFPEVVTPYESLLGLALSRSEEAAVRVANEIVRMPAVPNAALEKALAIINRHALLGKPLRETVVGIGTWDKALSENEGRRLVIYAWVAGYPESMAVAALLAETLPPNIGLIGINLDRDVALAQAAAAEHKLPATQFYDPAGPEGHVANALALKSVPLVYLVDADGVIISVSAHRDPAALVASLSTP